MYSRAEHSGPNKWPFETRFLGEFVLDPWSIPASKQPAGFVDWYTDVVSFSQNEN